MKAVYFESDWDEIFGDEVLVNYVKDSESESDAFLRVESYDPILRVMKLYDPKYNYYVK